MNKLNINLRKKIANQNLLLSYYVIVNQATGVCNLAYSCTCAKPV